MSDLVLKSDPTLQDLQEYVAQSVKERGFNTEDVAMRFMLLSEEIGEFSKAARQTAGLKLAANTPTKDSVAHEAADVLIVFLGLCNMLNIDLEAAFRSKEELNKQRVWK